VWGVWAVVERGGDEGMSKVHVGGVRKRAAWFFAFHFLLL